MSGWDCEAVAIPGKSGWDEGGASAPDWNTGGAAEAWNENVAPEAGGMQHKFEATNVGGDDFSAQDTGIDARPGEGGDSGACRNCGQEGHFARECPEPRKIGPCFNCGEEGHTKVDCTNPRKYKGGACHTCGDEGHPAAECPNRVCNNCKKAGHEAHDCKNPKQLVLDDVADKSEPEAWEMLESASLQRDIGDFKDAVLVLSKACPDYTYSQLERQFRKRGYNIYLIAMEKDHGNTWTNVNLQGETGKKYAVSYFTSDQPHRPSVASKWPASPEENLARLTDAGIPMDRGVIKCRNCEEIGHTAKNCGQEKRVVEETPRECYICGETGHRVRDCQQVRKPAGGRTCKICDDEGHIAKECPNRQKQACRKCGSEDHLAKECPEAPKIKCFYCMEEGHQKADCPKQDDPNFKPPPRDWSTFTCPICKEKGHGRARCPQNQESSAPVTGFGEEKATTNNDGGFSTGGGGWTENAVVTSSAPAEWESATAGQNYGGW